MAADLLNLSAGERLDATDLQWLGQDQPSALQAELIGGLLSNARSAQALYVLSGFRTTAGTGSGSSPAQNQLTISPGSGILAWRRDAATPRFGVMASLDGTDQVSQSVDLTYFPSATYRVWLRLNYQPSAETDRTFWNAASPGSEFARLQSTRLSATWEVQALADGSSPGPEWVAIARVAWTAPATQGGAGSLSGLQDTRPLYFEGRADTAMAFGQVWGGGANDRSSDRSTYGIGDLQTFLDAMRTCLEDIKGPGLRRWYDPGVGGLNVGFTPNAPVLGRVAAGSASTYLQGRTSASPSDAYLVLGTANSGYDGLHSGSVGLESYVRGNGQPITTHSLYGTFGIGNLAGTDLGVSPGRALAEIVVSAQGQSVLRLGARAYNAQVPCGIDVIPQLMAPDQTGNLAQWAFGTGSVQGPERRLFQLGKAANNHFQLTDSTNGGTVLDFNPTDRSLSLSAGNFTITNALNGATVMSYTSATQQALFPGPLQANGGLGVVGSATIVNDLVVGGSITNNNSTLIQGYCAAAIFSLKLAGNVLQTVITTNSIQIPASSSPPANPAPGAMFYRSGQTQASKRARVYIYIPDYASEGDDGLPSGWKAVAV